MKDAPKDTRVGEPADLNATIAALRDSFDEQPGGPRWRRDLTFVAFAVLAVAAAIWYTQFRAPARFPLTAYAVVEASVPESQSWVGIGFGQGLASYLQATGALRVLTDHAPHSLLTNLFGVGFEPASANAADYRLSVNLRAPGDGLLLAAVSLSETDNPARRYGMELTGNVDNLSDLAARVSLQVFAWLEVNPFSPQQRDVAIAALPADNQDLALYAQGVQALQRGLSREAIDHLHKIPGVATLPMANVGLARAYEELGYLGIAQDHISRASAGRHTLTRELQLNIEAQHHRLHNEWPRAQALYEALSEFYPEKVDYSLLLAQVRIRSGDAQGAMAVLDAVALDPRFADDPAVDMTRMLVLYEIGEWRAAMESADQAVAKANRVGARGLAAQALYSRANMNQESTDSSAVEAAYAEFVELENVKGQVNALSKLGSLARGVGRLNLAEQFQREALTLAESLQNPALINSVQQARAMLFDLRGDLEGGLAVKQSIVRNWEELRRWRRVAIGKENIVVSLYKMGRMMEARGLLEQTYDDFVAGEDRIGLAWYPERLGGIYMRMGDLQQAEVLFREALSNADAHPAGGLALHARYDLAQIAFYRGDDDAAQQMQASRAEFAGGHYKMFEGEATLFLAQLASDRQAALALAHEALAQFAAEDAGYYVAYALTVAVRAGDVTRCSALRDSVAQLAHRHYALLGHAALHLCGEEFRLLSLDQIDAEARSLSLFESQLEVAGLQDRAAARRTAREKGWFEPAHWSYP